MNRWINKSETDMVKCYGFCDRGYEAVVYFRVRENAEHLPNLVPKSRVAPLKKTTISSLELCATQMLAKLVQMRTNI